MVEVLPNYDSWKTNPPDDPEEVEIDVQISLDLRLKGGFDTSYTYDQESDRARDHAVQNWLNESVLREIEWLVSRGDRFQIDVSAIELEEVVRVTPEYISDH